jgi:hypothetical protein
MGPFFGMDIDECLSLMSDDYTRYSDPSRASWQGTTGADS